MNGQSNTNDLQKAIDEITGNGDASADAGVDTADLESQIKGQMGVPPVPPTAGAGVPEMPGATAPAEVAPEAGASDVAPIPGVSAPAAPSAASTAAEVQPASAGGDLAKVRESALRELVPLMDKVDITATEKFDIYTEVIENTKDKSIVEKAFEAAKSIEDEKVKAESLLKLVQMIDTL